MRTGKQGRNETIEVIVFFSSTQVGREKSQRKEFDTPYRL